MWWLRAPFNLRRDELGHTCLQTLAMFQTQRVLLPYKRKLSRGSYRSRGRPIEEPCEQRTANQRAS
eukprot:1177646-Prorocentrum_minimum.AAC.2